MFGLRAMQREAGGTALVFLPGLFLGRRLWEGVLTHCPDFGRPVFVFDRSSIACVSKTMTLEHITDALYAELAATSVRRAILVGGSFGGLLALELAKRHPEFVERLILSGVPGFGRDLRPGTTHGGLTRQIALAVASQLFFDRSAIPDWLIDASLAEVRHPLRLPIMIRLLRAAKNYDTLSTIAEIHLPAALIWGERDTITPLGRWALEARRCDWQVTTIARTGHVPMLERPKAFSRALALAVA
jgi:2-hydroxy-6-oxonona-2,4-dienedioate hydrolase